MYAKAKWAPTYPSQLHRRGPTTEQNMGVLGTGTRARISTVEARYLANQERRLSLHSQTGKRAKMKKHQI